MADILNAGKPEHLHHKERLVMSSVTKIERLVHRDGRVITIQESADVAGAATAMRDNHVGALVVLSDQTKVVGIITDRDLSTKVVATGADPNHTAVREVMAKTVISCTPSTPIEKARKAMAQYQIRHLPIIEDGVPVGMISSRDIMAYELQETRHLAEQQSELLQVLEHSHPGITDLQKDTTGRLVI